MNVLDKGLIILAGIDEYDKEIFELIIPEVKLNVFYYNCSDSFNINICIEYLKTYKGNIVFANGDECFIYSFENGNFVQKKHMTANLQKRQKKGGQSALRIARLAEETRHSYIIRIVDNLNMLNRDEKTLLFGSKEITDMIISNNTLLQQVNYSGFLDFNSRTILDTKKWYTLLKNDSNYDNFYEEIVYFLDCNVDMLDFEPLIKNEMKYYIGYDGLPLPNFSNKYYEKLKLFEYIGVKYFNNIYIQE